MNHDFYAEALLNFSELIEKARAAGDSEPTAMTLATIDADGRPSARVVLLKGYDERGFVFYTNLRSRKGQELLRFPQAALLFHWKTLGHGVQVRIEGRSELVLTQEADAYFASRPRGSQIGAWASLQSETLPSREAFERRIVDYERQFEGQAVPRPPHWSGFRLVPEQIEFWFGAEFRLHERYCYQQIDGRWQKRMLYP